MRTTTFAPNAILISSKVFLAVWIGQRAKMVPYLRKEKNDEGQEKHIACDENETEFPGDGSHSNRSALSEHNSDSKGTEKT